MDHGTFTALQLAVSFVLVLLQLSTIPVILVYPDLRRRILYRIMLSISLSDFLQLYAIFHFTLYEFFGWHPSLWMEKFASGIYIIAWDHLIIQHFLLAMNRLIIIVRAYYSPTSFKQETPLENGIFNSLLLLSWLIMAILEVFFMTPYCGGIWDSEAVGFFYELHLECSDIYRDVELYFTIAFPAISIGCYVAIIAIMRKTRNIGKPNGNSPTGPNGQNGKIAKSAMNGQEKRILVISVLLFSIITALIFAWYINYKNPPWTMLFCCYLLINSGLTLTMNSEYRQRFLHMWFSLLRPLFPSSFLPKIHLQQSKSRSENQQQKRGQTTALFVRRSDQQQRQSQRTTTEHGQKHKNNMIAIGVPKY